MDCGLQPSDGAVDDGADLVVIEIGRKSLTSIIYGTGVLRTHVDGQAESWGPGGVRRTAVVGEAVMDTQATRLHHRVYLLPRLPLRYLDLASLGVQILPEEIAFPTKNPPV